MRFTFGMRIMGAGPILQKELAGLETQLAAAATIYPSLTNRTTPGPTITGLVEAGSSAPRPARGSGAGRRRAPKEARAKYERMLLAALALLRAGGLKRRQAVEKDVPPDRCIALDLEICNRAKAVGGAGPSPEGRGRGWEQRLRGRCLSPAQFLLDQRGEVARADRQHLVVEVVSGWCTGTPPLSAPCWPMNRKQPGRSRSMKEKSSPPITGGLSLDDAGLAQHLAAASAARPVSAAWFTVGG